MLKYKIPQIVTLTPNIHFLCLYEDKMKKDR